jgi:hypothetical protein
MARLAILQKGKSHAMLSSYPVKSRKHQNNNKLAPVLDVWQPNQEGFENQNWERYRSLHRLGFVQRSS